LDEVYGQTPRILKSGKQTEAFYHQFWSNIAAARPVKAEFVNKTKDGRLVTVASSINPIVDQTGVVGFLAIQRDITEQKQLTKALELERDKVKSYMEVAGVMMVVLDDQARVEQINAKGLEILGYGEAEVIGREWFEFIPERLREEIRRVFSRAADGDVRQVMYYENPIVNKAGEERLIAWHNALLNNPDGGFRVISSGEDITERKRDEAELLVRTQELERLNKVMVGRELKMVELKEYIRQLETRVGQKES
jgi:PAS domain S-box-containing protein